MLLGSRDRSCPEYGEVPNLCTGATIISSQSSDLAKPDDLSFTCFVVLPDQLLLHHVHL